MKQTLEKLFKSKMAVWVIGQHSPATLIICFILLYLFICLLSCVCVCLCVSMFDMNHNACVVRVHGVSCSLLPLHESLGSNSGCWAQHQAPLSIEIPLQSINCLFSLHINKAKREYAIAETRLVSWCHMNLAPIPATLGHLKTNVVLCLASINILSKHRTST